MLSKLNTFHKSKVGYALFGLVELAIAYYFVSLAIDRGSIGWYLLTLVFLVGALQNLCKCFGLLLKRKTQVRRG